MLLKCKLILTDILPKHFLYLVLLYLRLVDMSCIDELFFIIIFIFIITSLLIYLTQFVFCLLYYLPVKNLALGSCCLVFCQFQPGVAYKSVA